MKYIILFFLFLPTTIASSLGISPSELEFTSPLREETITKEFIIFNPNPYTIVFEISDKKNLFNFEPKEGTILENKDLKIKATLNPTIELEDLIIINSYSMEDQNLQPSLAIKTKISPLTEKIESFEFKEIEVNENSIYLEILNNGNIKSSATLEIKIEEKIITEEISGLNPGESQELDINLDLPAGKYNAFLILRNENKIFSEKQKSFEITTNQITGSFLGSNYLDKTGMYVLLIIILIGIATWFMQRHKKLIKKKLFIKQKKKQRFNRKKQKRSTT
ncbi:hypothetical protein J4436_01025 [Candidatus Woesearchaeota archaeon]|nr:hypothetical protein [Candidatus Woesearchaeota archaeon]